MSNINEYVYEFLLTKPTFSEELRNEDKCRLCGGVLVRAHCGPCGCEFCYICIRNYLEKGPKQCPGVENECRIIELDFDKNISSNPATNRRIVRKEVVCANDGCCTTLNIEQMMDHQRFCDRRNLECPLYRQGCPSDPKPFHDIKIHLNNELPQHFQYLLDLIKDIKDENKELRQKLQNMEQMYSTNDKSLKIDGKDPHENDQQKLQNMKQMYSTNDKSLKIDGKDLNENDQSDNEENDIWKELKQSKKSLWSEIKNINQFIWIVENLSIATNAKVATSNPQNPCMTSPGFYTHPGGYKLQLLLYPTGYKQSTHLSLYFQLIPGKYDDSLLWPCTRNIFISTVDQSNGLECLTKLFNSDQVKDNNTNIYNRPATVSKELMGGCQCYINLADKATSNLMRNGKIIIKCKSSP